MLSNQEELDDLTFDIAEMLYSDYIGTGKGVSGFLAFIEVFDDGYRAYSFDETGKAENAWEIRNTDFTTKILELWEKMGREWDALLFMANKETMDYQINFYTQEEVNQFRKYTFDSEGIYQHYLSVRDENI